MPAYLCRLVERLAELDRMPAPSIVPCIDDMTGGSSDAVRYLEPALA
jgi:hypothetical protein